jgi:FixJ family two-component response regulator
MHTIAIVDDDTSHCRAVARLLRASGMQAITFPSAEDYLAARGATPVDCLILDIQLGGMSGFDLLHWLTAAGGSPPVVFLTAHSEPETMAQVAATGCAYVCKTDPGRVLLEAIRQAVADRTHPPNQAGGSA